LETLEKDIAKLATHPMRAPDNMIRIIGIKIFLDGGMLTGSAYMQKPWGLSKIYSIDDPTYRGLLFLSRDKLLGMAHATVKNGKDKKRARNGAWCGACYRLISHPKLTSV
jgi:predicted amidohydrolase YtcJ